MYVTKVVLVPAAEIGEDHPQCRNRIHGPWDVCWPRVFLCFVGPARDLMRLPIESASRIFVERKNYLINVTKA